MIARIGFVIEQALGHVAYGMGLRAALAHRSDIECEWLEIPFAIGAFSRLPKVGANWTLRGSLRAREAILRAHRQRPLDALFIHTQTVSMFAGPLMRLIPTVLSLDATPINYQERASSYGAKVQPRPIEVLKREVHRRVMQNARQFTVWSQWAKDSLVLDYGIDAERVTILHPGTTLSNFSVASAGARKPGKMRVLFVGGDFIRKGGDLLLEVFKNHLQDSCELHLVTNAEVPTGKGVHVYKGVKPHSKQLLELYGSADVFALPTRGDCLAVVLGEAMAAGLPIVTTRVGGHAEAVEDGSSGYLLNVDDAAGLRDSLLRLAHDPELLAGMGQRSRQIGEQGFDMQKNADKIADLLVSIGSH